MIFSVRHNRFYVLKSARGRSIVRHTIANAMKTIGADDLKRFRIIGETLKYVGFDPYIGIKIKNLKHNSREIVLNSELDENTKERLLDFVDSSLRTEIYNKSIHLIGFLDSDFFSFRDAYLIQIFLYEKILKQLKILSGVDIFLSRNNDLIPLVDASSGELSVITSLIYITSIITDNSVILIDEPENSLHPKWQIEYLKHFSELFYLYQPKIIIATHSPLIINGTELKNIKIFKGEKHQFKLHEFKTKNVEEIYEDYFDVTTPENRYLSEYVVEKMNQLANKDITIQQFRLLITELKENSYDVKQKEVLDGIISMGDEILKEI